jgi:RHS repeat-associated protein
VDGSNNVVGYDDYDPWGMLLQGRSSVSTADARYRFTEKERDPETGHFWFGARAYEPRIGRWLTVDPLAEKYPSLSPYSYVAGNPVNNFDPDGRAIYRKGEGYITGHRAKELTLQAIGKILQGQQAQIDFVQKESTWEDVKDVFRGGTYRHGGILDPSAVIFGKQLSWQTPLGTQRLSEFYVETAFSFEDIAYSRAELSGTTPTWQELVTLAFTTGKDGRDVVRFTGTTGEMNKYLKRFSRQLVRHTQEETIRDGKTGKLSTRQQIWYTLETIENENERNRR